MPRRVFYRPEFDIDCAALGGIAAVQRVIGSLIALLENGNLAAFSLLDVNRNIRYAATKPVGNMPALLLTFEVDQDDDVIMMSVDERD